MTIRTQTVEYRDVGKPFEAVLAWDDAAGTPRPGVLVAHAWRGRSEFEVDKARQLAQLGFCGFALDLFGKGVLGTSAEESSALIRPYMDDRALLQRRMQLALEQLHAQDQVDRTKLAALGFCFGGLCVLDLARSGADFRGAVSFHALLSPPRNTTGNRIRARVLVMHGWDDPLATPVELAALGHELTSLQADWQIHVFGNAMHAFTNRQANDAVFGTVYQADADRRSWQLMQIFFKEIFA